MPSVTCARAKCCIYVQRLRRQGRRRVFKSGPAEETIECRRDERGRGGLGVCHPLDFFLILSASMCVLMGFMRLGTDFSHDFLPENIFLGE